MDVQGPFTLFPVFVQVSVVIVLKRPRLAKTTKMLTTFSPEADNSCAKHPRCPPPRFFLQVFLSITTMSSSFSTPNWFKDRARQGRALFETARLAVTASFDPADGAADLSPQGTIARLPFRERNEDPANITYTQSLPEEPAWISGKTSGSSRNRFGTPSYRTASPPFPPLASRNRYGLLGEDKDHLEDDPIFLPAPTEPTGTPPTDQLAVPAENQPSAVAQNGSPFDFARPAFPTSLPTVEDNEEEQDDEAEVNDDILHDDCTFEDLFHSVTMLRTELNAFRSKTDERNKSVNRSLQNVCRCNDCCRSDPPRTSLGLTLLCSGS
jgi:hypothetical protein